MAVLVASFWFFSVQVAPKWNSESGTPVAVVLDHGFPVRCTTWTNRATRVRPGGAPAGEGTIRWHRGWRTHRCGEGRVGWVDCLGGGVDGMGVEDMP
eukprot:632735-Prorocentrum_minimum.AAC.2